MNNTIRNIIAVLIGLVIGGFVNMGLITIGPSVIPPPVGVDMTTTSGLKEGMALFEPRNFIFPFLAHALGTLVGALVAAKISANRHLMCALLIGFVFLLGGIMMVRMVGGPIWFVIADLVFAYVPMAYLGLLLSGKKND